MNWISKSIVIFIFGIFGGIFGSQILWPYLVERPLFYQYRLEKNPIYITQKKQVTIEENTALTDSIEKVERAVVGVVTITRRKTLLQGSGLILTSDGLVVTLASLVPRGSKFSFFANGASASFQILKRDIKENLALIKIKNGRLTTLPFGSLEKLKLGERVFLVGFKSPKGLSANEGIIKDFNKDIIETNIRETKPLAGSPLFDIKGDVLGISEVEKSGEVVAIPISKIKSFAGL